MHQQPLRRTDDDGSTLLESIDTFSAEIQDKIAKSCSKIEMKSELLDQSLDTIKSSFDDLHTVLNKREDALIDDLKAVSEESVKSQETFVKDAETLAESVDKLQDEMKKSVPISDQIAVNAYRRRLETMSGQFKGMLGKVFEPVFARDTSERIIEGLRVGQIKTEVSYKPAEDASATNGENWAMLKPDLKITDSDTFSLHRPDVDQKESIITSIVWKNGRILATDKSNRKLKIFTEEGQFLFEILFSNAEPYCVASIDSVIDRDDAVDKFAVTFPKAKYLYFVCYESKVKNKQPSIWFYFKTEVGYSGVSPGSRTNQLLCTVVSNSGDPRIDILDFQGHILQAFSVDSADRYLFSFPRYILTNANNIIVSDHKKK